ncbi:MAG: bifunctional glutamate N-acetyltransferase/amino-acid acetyltransferase ArgJ [Sphaerochaeta sp.]
MIQIIDGGITAAKGFYSNGIACGVKKVKKDLAIVHSKTACAAGGSFTQNIVRAAPVIWDEAIVAKGEAVHTIVINSGNANAATGEQGIKDTEVMATIAAKALGHDPSATLVCSTGVIGVPLPMDKIKNGINECAKIVEDSRDSGFAAAQAILTTDTFQKEWAVQLTIDTKVIHIGGMAKGSGMIHPNMATMLSFITTDALIEPSHLQTLLLDTVEDTYNMISVDGDTSTNDTVLVLANGEAGNNSLSPEHPQWDLFVEAFEMVNSKLAQFIVHDGEGATKFITMNVEGAADKQTARILARSVVSSNLVKAAFFGSDANWGRIMCAMGYSGAKFNPSSVDLFFASSGGKIQVVKDGEPVAFDEAKAKAILTHKEITCTASLQDGAGQATAWGCDLSYEYVRINGDYRS